MKNIKKMMALILGMMMSFLLFTGCSKDGTTLYNAINKTQKIKSSEVLSDITLNVSTDNLSKQEQQAMQTILPLVNASKLSIVTYTNQDKDNTVCQTKSDIRVTGPTPLDMSLWVNMDTTKDKPVVNEIFRMPDILTKQLPGQFKGKDYMVMDYNDMGGVQGSPQIDYAKLAEFSKEFQPKLLQFMDDYARQFNPNFNIVSKIGTRNTNDSTITQPVSIYEVKLDDKTFKDLIHYTLNNFAENKEAMTFLKDYMTNLNSIMGLPQNQENLNETFDQMPQMVKQLNEELAAVDNIKIIGDKGITIQYAVSHDGYIVSETGNAEFVINLPELNKLSQSDVSSQQQNDQKPTGIYTIDLNFNNKYYTINGYNPVTFPALNEYNSFNYTDLLKTTSEQSSSK
ncbi:hypothetical protein ACJDU8_22305 [Clostridium sp. WILCCON 0269]|uniref:Lipoprotein n=1 Tax=Candidatus Clostridium eludens TaxID=3381663 RepID=A0ABW8SRB0_9CLOT